jgi:hypothetical protein
MTRPTFLRPSLLLALLLLGVCRADAPVRPQEYFAIEVVDEQTGRGVPLVELQTTSGARYYTDSNGLVAFHEPGLMDRKVYFGVASHGYEYPADGFGSRGAVLVPKAGETARLNIRRLNIAERLYRITGQGIYRDTVLLGRKPPVAEPLLNAEVTGQDSIMTALYHKKLFWFYGDTSKVSYPLGNFQMSGATTEPPAKLDPSAGIPLKYFTGPDGSVRPMVPIPGEGVVWLSGLTVLPDAARHERMVAFYQRRRGLGAVLENGFVVYNDAREAFEKLNEVPLDPPLIPTGHPFRVRENGVDYVYFTAPYPSLRVRADWQSFQDLAAYESYTCLKPGARSGQDGMPADDQLDRNAAGKLVWGWKKDTPALGQRAQPRLVAAGKLRQEELPFRLQDPDTGKPIILNSGSCYWNAYRKRYVMIATQQYGATMLGETWYSESERPEGPWVHARKIITHANKPGDAHDFYNPMHHPYFDQEGGRVIYLEGTYVNTFSGNPHPTPYYEYNQIMYRLDLADPRLKVPE